MGLPKNQPVKSTSSSLNMPASVNSRIVFVGASTGGAEAIRELLQAFPADMPPVLIVQHMPELFTGTFAARLDGICQMRVVEAQDGDVVCHGTAYVAPGHSHMRIQHDPSGSGWVIALSKEPPFNHHRPSVDVLFNSAATLLAKNALGVILTGMGKDGARGLLAMREAGAHTLAQDEASCVVYGMPREAVIIGAAEVVAALHDLPKKILNLLGKHVF